MVTYDEKMMLQICANCKHWYKNKLNKEENGHECPWTNRDVPKACDFCSRWKPVDDDSDVPKACDFYSGCEHTDNK